MRFRTLTTSVTAAALALSSTATLAQEEADPLADSADWIFIPAINAAPIPEPDCSSIAEDEFTDPHHSELMEEMKSYLYWHSATGRELLTEAQTGRREPLEVCFVYSLGSAGGQYRPSQNLMLLENQGEATLGVLVHELGHHYLKSTGDSVFAHMERRDNRDLATFAGEAFAEATKNKVLWELREAGYAQFWDNSLTCAPRAFGASPLCYNDIAFNYQASRESGASAQEAHLVAFEAWFSMPRITAYVEERRARARENLSRGRVDLSSAWTWEQRGCTLPTVSPRVRSSMMNYLIAPAEERLPREERLSAFSTLDSAFTQAGRYMLLRSDNCTADEYMRLFSYGPHLTPESSAASAPAQP